MNGGRQKWLNESDKTLTTEKPAVKPGRYMAAAPNSELRAFVNEVMEASRTGKQNLVDVRSPDEFTGKVIAPPGMNETAQRGGHIPGAKSVPWSQAVNADGTFKSADDLRALYLDQKGVDPKKPSIAYCRIGERSSHTWFVLRYLLGLNNVKNYDGSWTEYGNLIGAAIEK
jgi:thiosulfate/3-mercaptopyruvate sulfurtransferase